MGIKQLIENDKRILKHYGKITDKVVALDEAMRQLSDDELKQKTVEFKQRYRAGETLDDLLTEAFAAIREGARRVLGLHPYPVQIKGGISLHEGNISEMRTGEGKTLTATMPVYLNALSGDGVHVVTVNEYLAGRDADEMGELYQWMGLTVGLNTGDLTPDAKRKAYAADVTYTTNSELGFDYLRDNMAQKIENQVQRPLAFAVIDEVDSILIDEARTPLIISGPTRAQSGMYMRADFFVKGLKEEEDYEIDLESKTIRMTEDAMDKAERVFRTNDLYATKNQALLHHIDKALQANYVMLKDKDYVVNEGKVNIVDSFTGRVMDGRRYSDGLHQAIEAKENVEIEKESKTMATITYQNFFRMYRKLAGMTGTGKTEEEEFKEIYNMQVIAIPTNKPIARDDKPDALYATLAGKYRAVVEEVKEKHATGQPVLVGTATVEVSELIGHLLREAGVPHEVLNAKNHSREADIIINAGQPGAVTIATNMAGRGTDIKLGPGVKELGGLAVIGTERHESRRIDNQLRGRAGRQGDPGASQFYLSLEDDLMERFGTDKLKTIMMTLSGGEDDTPINSKLLTKQVESAQKRVEGNNYDTRKNVLKYDDVMREQREIMYKDRQTVLEASDVSDILEPIVSRTIERAVDKFSNDKEELLRFVRQSLNLAEIKVSDEELSGDTTPLKERLIKTAKETYVLAKEESGTQDSQHANYEQAVLLQVVDTVWTDHIDHMDTLKEGIGLRQYAQGDPRIEYQEEGYRTFKDMVMTIEERVTHIAMNTDFSGNMLKAS